MGTERRIRPVNGMPRTPSIAITACLMATTGCSGEKAEPCIPEGSVGVVVVVTDTAGRPEDESHQVSIRKRDGVTTTCLGGPDAAKLLPGQTIDAMTLKPYPTIEGEGLRP